MSARILVIDDDDASRELATYLLEDAGYAVAGAEDGAAGIARALRSVPGLVLCDLDMPVKNGFEVLDALRASVHLRHLPVIGATASSMTGDRESTLAAGFDGYLPKPVTPERFVEQVEAFLAPGLRTLPRAEY